MTAMGEREVRNLALIERESKCADPALDVALRTMSPVRRTVWPWTALVLSGAVVALVGRLLEVPALVVLGTGCVLAGSVTAMTLLSADEEG